MDSQNKQQLNLDCSAVHYQITFSRKGQYSSESIQEIKTGKKAIFILETALKTIKKGLEFFKRNDDA